MSRPTNRDAVALWVEALRERGTARLTIAGPSMAPLLPDGCNVDVEAADASVVDVGDVVVVRTPEGLVTHRVLACHHGRTGARLLHKGDAGIDAIVVAGEAVVGRVVRAVDHDEVPVDAGKWRARHRLRAAYGRALGRLLPLGRWLRRGAAALPPRHPMRRLVALLRRIALTPLGGR